jgi:hypothetical protein
MNNGSSYPFKPQSSAPFSDEHIQSSSRDSVRIIQHRHPSSEFDGSKDGAHEDEFSLCFSDQRQEGADEDGVVDDFEVELFGE